MEAKREHAGRDSAKPRTTKELIMTIPHTPPSPALRSDALRSEMLRVGTFNIRWPNPDDGEHQWDRRKARLLDFLRTWGPDVLGLQEPLHGPLTEIRAVLTDYDVAAVGREDGQEGGEFCPVFFRRDRFALLSTGTFWFSETPEEPGSRGWGSGHPRICTWVHLKERGSGEAFFVYNLHWDNEKSEARNHSARILRERIAGRPAPDPVIVMGDFNAEATDAAVLTMNAPDSPVPISALRAVTPEPPGTFHGFTGEATGTPIDHILVSPEWSVEDAQILVGDGQRPFLSDHLPVGATLSRRDI